MSSNYDPRDHGADCNSCPFGPAPGQPWPFVPPTDEGDSSSKQMLVVLETPGKTEVERRAPAVGKSGRLLFDALSAAGVRRSDVGITQVCLCRPPGDGDLDIYVQLHSRRQRKREADGLERQPDPVECCRPRLEKELARAPYILALGAFAGKAVFGSSYSVSAESGAPGEYVVRVDGQTDGQIDGQSQRIPALGTVHPAFVLRALRMLRMFKAHVRRAVLRSRGTIEWVEPVKMIAPTPAVLWNWLQAQKASTGWISDDTETTRDGERKSRLKCVGFGSTATSVVVPFMSTDPNLQYRGASIWYDAADQKRIRRIMELALIDENLEKVGWNSGAFDRTIYERHFGVVPRPVTDLILAHRLVYPELPHTLDYSGRERFDVDAWKAGKTALNAESDPQLFDYLCIDVAVTARLREPLLRELNERNLQHLYELDFRRQEVCRQLHGIGMWVDESRRQELLAEWTGRIETFGRLVKQLAADAGFKPRIKPTKKDPNPSFNPNSTRQVADLVFDFWGCDPSAFTKLGDPSTEDSALRELIQGQATDEVRAFLVALRKYRRAVKLVGTYLRDVPIDPDDGRVHSTWLEHGTGVGRVSSSHPNLQNAPYYLRGMFAAQPGRVLVYGDWSQVHLRIIAAEAGDEPLIKLFREGADPHRYHASVFYGAEWAAANARLAAMSKDDPERKAVEELVDAMRQGSKTTCYAAMYLASLETVHETITSVEDGPEGNLLYEKFTMRMTRKMYEAFWRVHPRMLRWGERQVELFRRQGYVTESIFGRRCDFTDGEDRNAIVNWPVLSCETAIQTPAQLKLVELVPFGYAGPGTGLVHDGHDSMMLEVPEADADRVAGILSDCMSTTHKGVPITSEVKVGRWWDRMKKWKRPSP